MCFEFGSCFGNGRRQDYGRERPTTPRGGRTRGNHGNGYWSAYHHQQRAGDVQETGHKAYNDGAPKADHADAGGHGRYAAYAPYWSAPVPAYHHQPPPVVHEAGNKAYHDGAQKADHGGHGGYATYVQDKADDETPKLPAWHNKVGDDAGYGAYTSRPYEAAADHRNNVTIDYHGYSR